MPIKKTDLAIVSHVEQLDPEVHIQREGVKKVLTPPPISINISNIKYIFPLSENMSAIHPNYETKTKTKAHSSDVLIIVNLPVGPSLFVKGQSWTKSNSEQRFVVKYFFIKGWGNKKITAELQTTFQDSGVSKSTVKRWIRKFQNGDSSCDDDSIPALAWPTRDNLRTGPAEVP
jgi:hypothetical protein